MPILLESAATCRTAAVSIDHKRSATGKYLDVRQNFVKLKSHARHAPERIAWFDLSWPIALYPSLVVVTPIVIPVIISIIVPAVIPMVVPVIIPIIVPVVIPIIVPIVIPIVVPIVVSIVVPLHL